MTQNKRRFVRNLPFLSVILALLLCSCSLLYQERSRLDSSNFEQGSDIQFGSNNFSTVQSIVLHNQHNGKDTYIENPEDVQAICDFIITVRGINGTSGKGYYEGSYSLAMYGNASASLAILEEEDEIFSIGFGDSDAFFYGEYGDGHPVRCQLDDMTIDEVISFFQQYDEHPIS